MTLKLRVLTSSIIAVLSGCKTYYIPLDSFKEQLGDIDSTELVPVKARGPMMGIMEYEANPIDLIVCVDNKGNEVELPNGPSIETRITTKDGKRTIFYFDRLYIENEILIGFQSRFLEVKKMIPLSEITKIEVQNGQKNFKYISDKK